MIVLVVVVLLAICSMDADAYTHGLRHMGVKRSTTRSIVQASPLDPDLGRKRSLKGLIKTSRESSKATAKTTADNIIVAARWMLAAIIKLAKIGKDSALNLVLGIIAASKMGAQSVTVEVCSVRSCCRSVTCSLVRH